MSSMEQSEQKTYFWSAGQVWLASFLGGPLAGCYLLGRNSQESGLSKTAKSYYIGGILGTLVLLIILYFIPNHFLTKYKTFIPTTYLGLLLTFGQQQKKMLKEKFSTGYTRHSYFRCFLVALSLLVIQTFLFLLFLGTSLYFIQFS